jgi:hypothetical protein
VSDLEWWLKYGWYQLGVEDFAPVLVLTAAWLLVTVELFVFHRAKTRHGRGIVVAVPLIAWALFGFRQAINATQIDMAGSHPRLVLTRFRGHPGRVDYGCHGATKA